MHWIDYSILILVLVGLLVLGFALSRRSKGDTADFLVANRKMPWWLIGLSSLAVGLNTSNMLQDSRKVRQDGVMGLMQSWSFMLKSCIAGVFFERLWRRARFKTQMEFYETRYSGWQAGVARVFDTVVFGGFVTSVWAAVGLVGMKKIVSVVLGLPATVSFLGFSLSTESLVVVGVVGIALSYSAASGARGVYWTDMVEFVIAIVPLYALFCIVYLKIGGSVGLREHLESLPADKEKYLSFLQPMSVIVIYFFVVNPLLDHGGFNPGMQRTLSLKGEREVIYTYFFTNVIGFVVRGMPFIAIGLIGMFLIDDAYLMQNYEPLLTPEGLAIPDWERVFPILVSQYLPVGLTGLMAAAFLCAFMSSFDSNVHLTGSVLVNDLYRPYIVKEKSEQHYVLATKIVMTLASLGTIAIGIFADDILYLGYLALMITLGGGWFKMLRLIWWRANGASEVAAQAFSIVVFAVMLSPLGNEIISSVNDWMGLAGNDAFYVTRNLLAGISCTLFAFAAMCLSKPEPMNKLCSFYRRMRPFGFWGPVREALGDSVGKSDPIGTQFGLAMSMVSVVWGGWFVAMCLLLAYWGGALASVALIVIGLVGSLHFTKKLYPNGEVIDEVEELSECSETELGSRSD